MQKFRPILSVIITTGYNIAKFLIPILEPLTHNEFTVKDSFTFAKKRATYDKLLHIVILDVESIFTAIPLNETISNCASDLHNTEFSKRDLSFIFNYFLS